MTGMEGPESSEKTPEQIIEEVHLAGISLGFTDLMELSVARTKLWETSESPQEDKAIINKWISEGMKIVTEQMDPHDYRPQIGLLVTTAELQLIAGLEDDAIESFRNAIDMAHGSNDYDLADKLHTILHGKPYE